MMTLVFILLACPVVSSVAVMATAGAGRQSVARWIALAGSLATLGVAIAAVAAYPDAAERARSDASGQSATAAVDPPIEYRKTWLEVDRGGTESNEGLKLEFYLGVDGVSIALIAMTALLTVSSVLISWEAIDRRQAEYYAAILILEAGLIGVFCAFDLVLFYVFFEFTLVPLFFLIAIWGGPQRRWAAIKFFLYTLAGSLVTLLGLVMLVSRVAADGLTTPTSLPDLAAWLADHPLDQRFELIVFGMLAVGFMVKTPLFPFHTWLPLAHVEAPTAGSVLLAGVLLKLGTYGFFRLCLPLLPAACLEVGLPLIAVLSLIGIVYGSFCALVQRDIKRLVAYSSIAHMGFCMLGLFALNVEGISGGVLQMINHGLSTGGLFLLVGMVYERYHSRTLDDLGGLAARLPYMACLFVFIAMASIGLPGLNGFVGEFLSLAGMFQLNRWYAAVGATGVILAAWYLLTMLQHLLFGPLKEPRHHGHAARDINFRELAAIVPIAAACLWIGVQPQPLLRTIRPEVKALAEMYDRRMQVEATAKTSAGGQVDRVQHIARAMEQENHADP